MVTENRAGRGLQYAKIITERRTDMANYQIIFSPTGGTAKVADTLIAGLGGAWEKIDISLPVEAKSFGPDDVCLVAVPSFGGLVPVVALERLKALSGGGTKTVAVCVYGNRLFEDTLTQLQEALEAAGFCCAAAVSAVAEHSFMRQYAAGRPDADDCAELTAFVPKIAAALADYAPGKKLVVPGNYGTYKNRGSLAFHPAADEKCVACGLCASKCPVGAIDPACPGTTNNDACITCMRCVALCPKKARGLDANVVAAVAERLKDAFAGRKPNGLYLAE